MDEGAHVERLIALRERLAEYLSYPLEEREAHAVWITAEDQMTMIEVVLGLVRRLS